MNHRILISLLASLIALGAARNGVASEQDWKYEMGWRYVKYSEPYGSLVFSIEPMVKGADVVYVPDSASWAKNSPNWAKGKAQVIVARLNSVQWHRNLRWVDSAAGSFPKDELPIPGSLEDTSGGRTLESYRLFHPTSQLTHEEAHEIWHSAARKFAESATGRVTVFADAVDPDTVFGAIEVPALRANQNVTLDWR